MNGPAGTAARDPAVDGVRAIAICGVVAGHWLVTAAVADDGVADGLRVDSPLRYLPEFIPLSWVLQSIGLFFFAGGFAGAVGVRRAAERHQQRPVPGLRPVLPWREFARWYLTRCRRLLLAVVVVLACWAVVLAVLAGVADVAGDTVDVVVGLVTSPLWFLGVYVVLLAGVPLQRWAHARCGMAAAVVAGVLAIGIDVLAAADGVPSAIGFLTVVVVWLVPWQLGVAVAESGRPPVSWLLALLVTAAAAMAVCILAVGYPASAVGGTAERSNLNPPSPVVLFLALAQVALVLLATPLVARLGLWRPLRWVNTRALPIFLLHQSALVTVLLLVGAFGTVAGLHGVPDDVGWVLARLVWLPVFGAVLLVLLRGLQGLLRTGR